MNGWIKEGVIWRMKKGKNNKWVLARMLIVYHTLDLSLEEVSSVLLSHPELIYSVEGFKDYIFWWLEI